jgi:adenylyltransferase/sulfurtransferase
MLRFEFSRSSLDAARLAATLADRRCGGYCSFEGWVRDHNEGRSVLRLEYEAFEALATKEGERILEEARQRFGVEHVACVHRIGELGLGELAVWVGASAAHRDEAFRACRYVIDEVKHRLPIWKKEHYHSGDSGWVNCERCAAPSDTSAPAPAHAPAHTHTHAHSDAPAHEPPAAPAPALSPDYSRQTALAAVGAAGQRRLRAASVLVVGAGGLGVPVLSYLAGAGIGRLAIVDGDRLEPSNLHRQTLYALADCGQPKAELAAARVRALNPEVQTRVHLERLEAANAPEIVRDHDVIVDCSDNFATKFLLNDVAQRAGKILVLASVYQYEGQLQVVRGDRGDGACLRCVWPEATRDGLVGNCAEAGVLGPVPGVFGSLQALETLKILLDLPGQLRDELLLVDLATFASSRLRARRAAGCAHGVCARIASEPEPRALEREFDSLDAAIAAGYEILDVREPAEVEARPTPAQHARRLPVAELLRDPAVLDPSARWLIVCARGSRSLAVSQELRRRGFRAVESLRGGLAGLAQPGPERART